MKRVFDVFSSCIGLFLFSPIFILLAIWIKYDSKGNVFYRQSRVGKDNRDFKIFKFRSMIQDSDKKGLITIGGRDPRVTDSGYYIRKYKLDELPQLFNILKGEMSFVGPRPDVAGYADKLIGEDRLMLKVKPGITGPAQLKYRKEEEILSNVNDPIKYNDEILWPDKVKINVEYVKNWSFKQDLIYMFQTIFK